MSQNLDPSTLVVSLGRPARTPDSPLNTPIVAASSFIAGGEWGYARYGNPTVDAFERTLGALEGGTAVAFSSGMGAAHAIINTFDGSRVLLTRPGYAGVQHLMTNHASRYDLTMIEAADHDALITAASQHDVLWLESPTNPLLVEVPLSQLIEIAHANGAIVVVDNTFATPLLQQPLALGADYVLHSATKMLSGHSDLMLGAVVASDPERVAKLREARIVLGAAPSAFDAFLALRGMRTLALRVERAQASAQILATRLESHPAVTRVRYPGYGSMLAIELNSSPAEADAVCSATQVWANATSLGGVESLLERRRSWEHEDHLVPETLIRLSVGIEHPDDLWNDLAGALSRVES
jgi:cystathionine gamma-synthase